MTPKKQTGREHSLQNQGQDQSQPHPQPHPQPKHTSGISEQLVAEGMSVFKNDKKRQQKKKRANPNPEPPELISEDDLSDSEISPEILKDVPHGKRLKALHAVVPINGALYFLVQWKSTTESESIPDITHGHLPSTSTSAAPIASTSASAIASTSASGISYTSASPSVISLSLKNANIVTARALNERFPQEVIKFYSERIRLFDSQESLSDEDKKASGALKLSQRRQSVPSGTNDSGVSFNDTKDEDDEDEDAASKAIEKENRKYDKFSVRESDSECFDSEDDGIVLTSDESDDD